MKAPTVGRILHQRVFQQLDRLQRRRARNRIAAKRARVRAGRPRHHVRPRRRHAERQARRDALGDRDHVGLDTEVLDREHLPGAPHPRLHFIGDQQDAVLLGDLAQAMMKLRLGHDVAALALDRLDDDAGDFIW